MIKRKLCLDKEMLTEQSRQVLPNGGDPWHTMECPTATCMCNATFVIMHCTNWCPIKTQ